MNNPVGGGVNDVDFVVEVGFVVPSNLDPREADNFDWSCQSAAIFVNEFDVVPRVHVGPFKSE